MFSKASHREGSGRQWLDLTFPCSSLWMPAPLPFLCPGDARCMDLWVSLSLQVLKESWARDFIHKGYIRGQIPLWRFLMHGSEPSLPRERLRPQIPKARSLWYTWLWVVATSSSMKVLPSVFWRASLSVSF
jgi:hypothetical protein